MGQTRWTSILLAGATYESWALDDADSWVDNDKGERNLFAVVRHCDNHKKTLLLTAQRAVRDWSIQLADLHSRLAAMPSAAIMPPDDALLSALITKLFHDRQRKLDDDVVAFMVSRMERRFDVAIALVGALRAARRRKTAKNHNPAG